MKKIFEILEFDKIKNLILKYNINELSQKKLEALTPFYFEQVIQENLDKTREAYNLYNHGTFVNLASLKDLENSLSKVSKNASLNVDEIYEFVNTLQIVNDLKAFVLNNKLEDDKFFYTKSYITSLIPVNELLEQIKYCITPNLTFYDHASAKLKQIRTQIRKIEVDIKEKLNSFLKNNSNILQDNYIANRANHFAVPIKAAYKNQVKGIVIDVSDSQSTYFIEPYGVMESNVMLEQLYYDEQIEIARIIKALCLMINKHHDALMADNEILAELSFMLLKGAYGMQNNYEIASLNDQHSIELIGAFHPLIDVKKVISNDFYLGGNNNNVIVISGPNAGGKTVSLKTLALIVLMNQCGLPIPVKSANIAVFRNIFVDIGDEQSIEQDLSGFSSHMKNVSNILNQIDSHSLVVLDELASKTDPMEGQALAKAIIEYIVNSKAIALVTTHYLAIKDYAKQDANLTLASMGFDEKTLEPTYKLQLNMVGRSYGLEIASRFGLSKDIIDNARKYKDEKSNYLDGIIDELSIKLAKENELVESMKEKEAKLSQDLAEIENQKNQLEKQKEKILAEVYAQKDEMIEQAYNEINQIVETFKNENGSQGFKHHLKNQAVDALNKLSEDGINDNKIADLTINVGDTVLIKSISKQGVVKDIKGNKCVVETDNNTLRINLSELSKIAVDKVKINKKVVVNRKIETNNFSLSLNLIGMHVDEALIALKTYLDGALYFHIKQVTIIHGYGTGALRKAVHEYLKKTKFVDSFELGGANDGGAGATLVKLKS